MLFQELGRLNTAYLLLWICVLFVPACKEIKRSDVPAPIINPSVIAVNDAAENVTSVSDDLGEIAANIAVATDSIEEKDERHQMKPEVAVLREEVPRIESERAELAQVTSSLTSTAIALQEARDAAQRLKEARAVDWKRIKILETQIKRKDAEIQKLNAEASKSHRKLTTYLALLGVICCAICSVLLFNGKGGIGLGVFGITLIVGATAASWIYDHGWIAGVAVLVAVGAGVWYLFDVRRKEKEAQELVAVKEKANEELVATTEKIKKYLPPDAKVREFGDMVGDGEVGNLQSENTKKIVRDYRQRLQQRVARFVDQEKNVERN